MRQILDFQFNDLSTTFRISWGWGGGGGGGGGVGGGGVGGWGGGGGLANHG